MSTSLSNPLSSLLYNVMSGNRKSSGAGSSFGTTVAAEAAAAAAATDTEKPEPSPAEMQEQIAQLRKLNEELQAQLSAQSNGGSSSRAKGGKKTAGRKAKAAAASKAPASQKAKKDSAAKKQQSLRPHNPNHPGTIPVVQVDASGENVLQEFPSGKAAAIALGIFPESVSKVLRGKNKSANGFHFRYKHEHDLARGRGKPRKIEQLDSKTKQVIKVYDSIAEAARALNITPSGINKSLPGRTRDGKPAAGYLWRFQDVVEEEGEEEPNKKKAAASGKKKAPADSGEGPKKKRAKKGAVVGAKNVQEV